MPGVGKLVVLSAAMLFSPPALAVAQDWPPGSAMAVGMEALRTKGHCWPRACEQRSRGSSERFSLSRSFL